jgi:hypothetical protein
MQRLVPTAESPWLISPSHLNAWHKCRKQFYYKHVLQQRWLSDERNFILGKAVHALMDVQARRMPLEHLLQAQPPAIQETFRMLVQHPLAQAPVVASEWSFEFPLSPERFPHVYLSGRIDRICQGNAGQVSVVDWKTGTAVPRDYPTAWQTRLYLWGVWEARTLLGLPETLSPEYLMFQYVAVKPGKMRPVETFDVQCSQAYLDETRRLVEEQVGLILQEERFALPSACPDAFCPYRKVCGIEPPDVTQLPLFGLPEAPTTAAKRSKQKPPVS